MPAFSQIKVVGSVVAESTALAGATIQIKHTYRGTTTDMHGSFEIIANTSDTLLVSYLGYLNKEIVLFNKKNIQINMTESPIQLDDIHLIIYPTELNTCVLTCENWCVKTGCSLSLCEVHEVNHYKNSEIVKLYPNPSPDGMFNINIKEGLSI